MRSPRRSPKDACSPGTQLASVLSEHMVALQEDAKLLVREGELLSGVEAGGPASYVAEARSICRRKLQLYERVAQLLDGLAEGPRGS